jgi:hypothetical protein
MCACTVTAYGVATVKNALVKSVPFKEALYYYRTAGPSLASSRSLPARDIRTYRCMVCCPTLYVCLLMLFAYLLTYVVYLLAHLTPIPVAPRSKAWVCGHSLAGIAGLNSTVGMDVCLLWVFCVVR